MSEFFEGWQRKTGCIVLAFACLFAAGWMRSFWKTDTFGWVNGEPALPVWLASVDGTFVFVAKRPMTWTFKPSLSMWETEDAAPLSKYLPDELDWNFQWFGVRYGKLVFQFVTIPYPVIVIPLTLLSACLLVWKSRLSPKANPGV